MTDYFPNLLDIQIVRAMDYDDTEILDLIWRARSVGIICPKCNKADDKWYLIRSRRAYSHGCGKQFSPTANTVFAKHRRSLRDWFDMIYDIYYSNGMIPAKEIQRRLQSSYPTAWRIKKRVAEELGLDNSGYSYIYSSATNGRYGQPDYLKKRARMAA